MIPSELKNEREYDLMTTGPTMQGQRTDKQHQALGARSFAAGSRRLIQLRAIRRAPAFVLGLYKAGLIDAELARQRHRGARGLSGDSLKGFSRKHGRNIQACR
jgi:hypothetical protein